MYDIHSHILPGVDDGSSDMENALEIARTAEQAGFEAIVCTPHYTDDKFKNNSENNMTILDNFKKALEVKGIDIQLYLGNEVFINPGIIELLDMNRIRTLNNSRYILLEMPIYRKPFYMEDIIFKLRLRGLIPVIAHPERYEWMVKNPAELRDIISKGCLTQINIASINGFYGRNVRKAAEMLAKENCIHLLGSDCHSSKIIYNNYKADLKRLQRITSEYAVEKIIQNTRVAINNQAIGTLF